MAAERTISRITAAARLRSELLEHCSAESLVASGAAQYQHREQQCNAHHAATSRTTASVVRGLVWPTSKTPTQISTTPTQRRGETFSCRKTTARRVRSA